MLSNLKINNPFRYTYGFIFGIIFKFILDIIFSLMYTNYRLFQPLNHYLFSIILVYVVFEILFWYNKKLNRKYSWDQDLFDRFVIQLLMNSLMAISLVFIAKLAIRYYTGDMSFVSSRNEITMLLYIFSLVMAFVIMDLSLFLLNKWRFSLAELERFKKENAEYRFELLQSQLNPHFLFNSLNTLSSLVYENQENAGLFIRKLSDVYRYILDHRDKDVVDLETELDFARSYILLMKLRFEENLKVDISLEEDASKYQMAPLTLQLLIENAIKHNIVSKKKPLQINIVLKENYLEVSNNLQPKTNKEYSHQLGLKNISNRYQFLTDREVTIENNESTFKVRIPLINKES